MPGALGAIPGVAQGLAVLGEPARTLLIAPDEVSVAAIGPTRGQMPGTAPLAEAASSSGTPDAASNTCSCQVSASIAVTCDPQRATASSQPGAYDRLSDPRATYPPAQRG